MHMIILAKLHCLSSCFDRQHNMSHLLLRPDSAPDLVLELSERWIFTQSLVPTFCALPVSLRQDNHRLILPSLDLQASEHTSDTYVCKQSPKLVTYKTQQVNKYWRCMQAHCTCNTEPEDKIEGNVYIDTTEACS